MSNKQPSPLKAVEPALAQISGARKDQYLRGVLQELPDLDEALVSRIAEHLSGAIELLKADRSRIERLLRPKSESQAKAAPFDPHAFSLMKVFRTAGERGLRDKLLEIEDSGHLQALATAQKISLPVRLRAEGADAAGLKEAIVSGIIRRHEDWQAAS